MTAKANLSSDPNPQCNNLVSNTDPSGPGFVCITAALPLCEGLEAQAGQSTEWIFDTLSSTETILFNGQSKLVHYAFNDACDDDPSFIQKAIASSYARVDAVADFMVAEDAFLVVTDAWLTKNEPSGHVELFWKLEKTEGFVTTTVASDLLKLTVLETGTDVGQIQAIELFTDVAYTLTLRYEVDSGRPYKTEVQNGEVPNPPLNCIRSIPAGCSSAPNPTCNGVLTSSCGPFLVDDWNLRFFIDCDCNGNEIIDSFDVDPSDPDGDGFVSEDFNLDGVPDECQCIADIAPVDLVNDCGYGDGVVDELDLFRLLANWGDCVATGVDVGYCSEGVCDADGTNCTPICEGDLNRDGFVNVTDLLKMLGQFGDCQIPPYDPFFVEPFSLIGTCQTPAGNPVDATLDGFNNPTVGAISTTATEIVADDFILDVGAELTDITWMGYEQVDANCGSVGCGVTVEDEFLITIYGSILHPAKGVPVPDMSVIEGQWRNDGGPGDEFMLNRALAGYDESCGAQPLFVYSALLDSTPMLTAGVLYWIEITSLKTDACPWRWSWASKGNKHAAFRSGAAYTGEPASSVRLRGDLAVCFNFEWSWPDFFFRPGMCVVFFEGFPEVSEDCDGDGEMNWCEVCNWDAVNKLCDLAGGATDSNGDWVPDCCDDVPHTCP